MVRYLAKFIAKKMKSGYSRFSLSEIAASDSFLRGYVKNLLLIWNMRRIIRHLMLCTHVTVLIRNTHCVMPTAIGSQSRYTIKPQKWTGNWRIYRFVASLTVSFMPLYHHHMIAYNRSPVTMESRRVELFRCFSILDDRYASVFRRSNFSAQRSRF